MTIHFFICKARKVRGKESQGRNRDKDRRRDLLPTDLVPKYPTSSAGTVRSGAMNPTRVFHEEQGLRHLSHRLLPLKWSIIKKILIKKSDIFKILSDWANTSYLLYLNFPKYAKIFKWLNSTFIKILWWIINLMIPSHKVSNKTIWMETK